MQLKVMAGLALTAAIAGASAALAASASPTCDKVCLEDIGARYRKAYLAHDAKAPIFAAKVRYTENNVEMPFPDGTWDTVTAEVGPSLVISDPKTGQVAIYTAIRQRAIDGFLAVRLKVVGRKVTEVEHIISTKRNLSSPPTPIGEVGSFSYDPVIDPAVAPGKRANRAALIAHANGYFDTLQHNNGEIRGTCFHDDATRRENGMLFSDIKGGFKSGRYAFNDRVRREIVLVDEARQVVMARGFIDHKGQLDEYRLTDGTKTKSIFQEPQSWGLLEMFKVTDGCIAAVVATFYQAPYHTVSPWTPSARR